MVVLDTNSEGGVVERDSINTFEQDTLVVMDIGQCVGAIEDLSNEAIIEVVDHLLKGMDDADLYGEWAKRISDGYHRDYEQSD